MNKIKTKLIFTIIFTIIIILALITMVYAYFTSYAVAKGVKEISFDFAKIENVITNDNKTLHVSQNNVSNTPCYIRIKAFAGSKAQLRYSSQNGKWILGDNDYYYYSDVVLPNSSTEEILIDTLDIPSNVDNFNVFVVAEATRVYYNESGEPYADWTERVSIE